MSSLKYQPVAPATLHPVTVHSHTPPHALTHTIYCYALLLCSIVAISCAGTLQREISTTPPLLRSFWRLFCVSIALLVPWYIQYRYYTTHQQQQLYKSLYSREWLYIIISGIVTSIHFGSWIISLDHTSLTHSLTLVSIHPLILTVYYMYKKTRLSVVEYIGVIAGTIGTLVLCAGIGDNSTTSSIYEHSSTWLGDMIATLGAITLVINMLLGQQVRKKFGLFLFVFPVTLISTVPLLIGTCLFEHTCNILSYTQYNTYEQLYGFMYTPQLYYMIMIVVGPGLCGHTVMNYLLLHINPLSISIGFTTEPVLGTLIGLLFNVSSAPDIYTYIGGTVTIIASIAVTIASYKRESAHNKQETTIDSDDIQLNRIETVHLMQSP